MKKFQDKYRIPSARAQWWDYGNDGVYFITICTKGRECCFGDIVDGEMKFSHVGLLADVFWYEIKNHAKNITLDAFQVMPNHIHGVLILDGNERETNNDKTTHNDGNMNSVDSARSNDITVGVETTHDVETTHALSLQDVEQTMNDEQTMHDVKTMVDVETTHALSLQCAPEPPSPGSKRFQHQGSNTISSIIGSYKSAVTKHAHRLGFEFEWQERFHDIIIRDEESYIKIVDYIKNNPAKWDEDKFNPANNKTGL